MTLEWDIGTETDEGLIRTMQKAAERCPACEGIKVPCFVSVRLCDDEEIRNLNAERRGIDKATDVLSFPSVSYPAGKTAGDCEGLLKREYDDEMNACFLGDIVISVPHMEAQAREYGHSREREAAYLLVHGICHLMGYDHMEEEEKKKMRNMEEKILGADER